ncbi:DUF2505 domain-containing protein [Antrihabitans sp. YC2-6]|uniref:DUF2505 domain-containing protein n=1 Tax=Antrihabitans sp. YC2-6 TaxID=2799498 RepID=UPI0018F68F3F|nr:DUF2505 domain-containing protein [Antrihabitans sp. YC2-6]MBJ8347925.1 DUF2505 domain-containing protein [Antrihabitans sp. YC2-6]
MSRSFEFTVSYPSPPAVVHEALTTDRFWHSIFEGAENASVETSSDGPGTLTVAMVEHVGRAALPGPVRKAMKGDLVLTHTDRWSPFDGERAKGTFDGGSTNMSGRIEGTMLLRPEGEGSILEVAGLTEVKVRIIGGMLESMVENMIKRGFNGKRDYVEKWISQQSES